MSKSLLQLSYKALLDGAKEVAASVTYEHGYTTQWKHNLMNGLPWVEIERDLGKGAGRELEGKLCAAHSSAALVVNTFGPWRTAPASLTFGGMTQFRSMQFEAPCPTGLGGTPPHLDLLAEGDLPVAVESKCTEWMKSAPAMFPASYDKLRPSHGDSPWFEQICQVCKEPTRYRFLDAAQIIKHALGLLKCYRTREVRLVHLYWEPRNANMWPECCAHRNEADDLAAKVHQSLVRLIPMSYRELWLEWQRRGSSDHQQYLRTRYDLTVPAKPHS